MAMKLPVVASDTAATREVVTHLRDGFLFPAGDIDKMCENVEGALTAPGLRIAVAERALRKVQGRLSASASAAALAEVVEDVLRGTAPREMAATGAAAAG
jgi:glycosyltransferase involved in cell wall biosynthesis